MAIILDGIVKGFGEQLVVSKLNLEVHDGEMFVLLGSSGSGKSTILRIIAGLLFPDEGNVILHGRDVTDLPPQKRDAGFVFQNYAIFRHMTVAENVEFGLRIRNVEKEERRRKRENLLDLVGLGGLGQRFPSQLSGGQQQRVALARALAYEPAVLLLDEPFGALDAEIRSQLRRTLKDIQRQIKVSTILVTHDQEEAFELADRIGVLERGILIEVGTPETLYYKPKKEFVAKFLGGGNVVVARAEQGAIRLGSAKLPFPEDAPHHEEGAPVRLLFRPEMVVHSKEQFAADGRYFPIGQGKLTDVKFSGATKRLHFELETLTGARPVMPALAYGQRFANIACTEQSFSVDPLRDEISVGEKRFLALSHYHVLQPSALKFVALNTMKSDGVLKIGKELAIASHGTLTLLRVAPDQTAVEAAQKDLQSLVEQLKGDSELHVEKKVREGQIGRSLLREVQEGYYDIALVERQKSSDSTTDKKLLKLVRRLLVSAGIPVLISNSAAGTIRKILICTAGGEPGKTDVRFGARIARHLKSAVTVFHAMRTKYSEEQKKRVARHMEQAAALVNAYNLQCDLRIGKGAFLDAVLKETKDGSYDLIVIGAPGSYDDTSFELFRRLSDETASSILVVPQAE